MIQFRFLFLLLSMAICFEASARVVTDTLCSAQKDRLIITYDLKQSDERVEIRFTSIKAIRLGDQLYNKYRNTSEMVAVFFDRVGGFEDLRFSGLTPKALSWSPGVNYMPSTDGYFILDPYQYPSLVFEKKATSDARVTIPMYLAHYEKKRHYEILCSFGSLEVKLGSQAANKIPTVGSREPSQQNQQIEIEPGLTDEESEALTYANSIMKRLPEQTEAPISATLEQEVKNLINLKSKIKNENVQRKIEAAIDAYEAKNKELNEAQRKKEEDELAKRIDDDAFNQCISIEACELYLNSHPNGLHVEEVKAKKAELEATAMEKENKEKKRNIWMIIGGALLAVLLFVGNQVMQTLRNRRTQRNMMQMQQDAVNRAKNTARNKAQGAIRKQTNKVVNQARQKSQSAVRNAVDGIAKPKGKANGNNNRVSI